MNERIKELAKQADEYASQFAYVQAVGHPGYKEKFNEKFAELIVRECIHVAYNKMAIQKLDGIRPSVVCDTIKEHFGVEE